MRTENVLSNFELMVLLALIRLGDNAYGVPISLEIEERSGRDVSIGSIYAALERLEGKGFVSSELGEPTPNEAAAQNVISRLHGLDCARCATSKQHW